MFYGRSHFPGGRVKASRWCVPAQSGFLTSLRVSPAQYTIVKGRTPAPYNISRCSYQGQGDRGRDGLPEQSACHPPNPQPLLTPHSALSPWGSAMFACLPACLGCHHHPPLSAPVTSGSSQCLVACRDLEEMGWASVEHSGVRNQVAQNPTLLFQAAEMTLWIICVSEDGK